MENTVLKSLKMKTNIKNILIIIISITIFLIPIQVITISQLPNYKLLWIKRGITGEVFKFSYIHSVSKTPIVEVFNIDKDGQIKLIEVEYTDQGGAGMPEYPWDSEIFEIKNNRFIIKNFNRSFKSILITVQPQYEDKLLFEEDIYLTDIIRGSGSVEVKVKKIPFIIYLFNKVRL